MSVLHTARRWWTALWTHPGGVYGINRRNVELVYANNAREDYPIADDKILGKEVLTAAGVPVPETLAVCDGLYDIPRVLDLLAERENFVLKPANGGGGNGILVVAERQGPGQWRSPGGRPLTLDDLRTQLAGIVFGAWARGALSDRALIEPRIVPHPIYRALWADGLCDVRVIVLRGAAVMSMVRVPTHRSKGRANLHQGGLGLAVDLKTGVVTRALCGGRAVTEHPDSGAPLVGMQLPCWPETLDVARRAGVAVPLGYIGADVVVDEARGPLVLEINARPGLEIQNVTLQGLGAAIGDLP